MSHEESSIVQIPEAFELTTTHTLTLPLPHPQAHLYLEAIPSWSYPDYLSSRLVTIICASRRP